MHTPGQLQGLEHQHRWQQVHGKHSPPRLAMAVGATGHKDVSRAKEVTVQGGTWGSPVGPALLTSCTRVVRQFLRSGPCSSTLGAPGCNESHVLGSPKHTQPAVPRLHTATNRVPPSLSSPGAG